MTPETATSTHYFWAFARDFRLDEPGVTEFLRANVGRTFDEDKDMLESQQRIGDVAEPVFSIAVKADAGPTQGQLLASLIEAEARGA
jgi:vanillate O-demethylase monooxygenase subunit